jgi:hypothetical protein
MQIAAWASLCIFYGLHWHYMMSAATAMGQPMEMKQML